MKEEIKNKVLILGKSAFINIRKYLFSRLPIICIDILGKDEIYLIDELEAEKLLDEQRKDMEQRERS